ncbi:MAG: acetolactate synthase, partial [Halieaceae bacterium]|nr:acetolactate synthase [Halieaceae bacterium]
GPFNNLKRGSLQEMDCISLMRPITKWADACYETHRVAEYIELAVRHAVSNVPGPSYLEIPMDVMMGQVEEDGVTIPAMRTTPPRLRPGSSDVQEAIEILRSAEKPVILAGTNVKWSNAGDSLKRFISAAKIPTYVNGMARGILTFGHPQFFNRTRKAAITDCDVFLLAGAPLDFRLGFGDAIPATARIIQLDMENHLIGQNRSVDAAVVGNIGESFESLLQEMEQQSIDLDFGAWSDDLRQQELALEEQFATQTGSDEVPIDPLRMAKEVSHFVDKDTVLIGDGGDIVAQASKVIPVYGENCWMDPGPLGTLGVGMPFALAAKITFPQKKVFILFGDGSFGFNGFEFDTAIRFGLPIIGIIGNDAAWGQIMRPQSLMYGANRIPASTLEYTRYDKVVEALGGHGEYCERPEEIGPAIQRAIDCGKPALVNIKIRQDIGAPKGSHYT